MLLSENQIRAHLNRALRKLKLEHPLTRLQIIEVCAELNLHMSYLQATEAILYYRGKELDHSETYDQDRLLRWFMENIRHMRALKKESSEDRNSRKENNFMSKSFINEGSP